MARRAVERLPYLYLETAQLGIANRTANSSHPRLTQLSCGELSYAPQVNGLNSEMRHKWSEERSLPDEK
jgi:hypothetical protein